MKEFKRRILLTQNKGEKINLKKNDGINVLSLFDGMSCGQIALERIGIDVNKYFASEIKKSAIKVTKNNFPNTIHIGDVRKVKYKKGILYTENGNYEIKIDLLLGGSPCQDFSILRATSGNKINGLNGDKSILFYEYLRLLKEVRKENKYVKFLLENVRMNKDSKADLDKYLKTKGIFINSSLVSYQKRPRIYWTNIENVQEPNDRKINFQDFIDRNANSMYKLNRTPSREKMWNNGESRNSTKTACANITNSEKVFCLTRKQDRSPNSGLIEFEDFCRYLTREELEMAQTVPVGYTSSVSYLQAQDLLGDGWTVDVVAHILKNMKCE